MMCFRILASVLVLLSSQVASRPKLLVFGDSQAIGTYGELRRSLGQKYEYDLLAKVGSRISYWNKTRLAPLATPRDTVIVFLGSNGYDTRPEDPSLILESMGSAKCLWVGPPKIRGRQYRFTQQLREAVENRCEYFDSQRLPLRLPDQIHPDSLSARLWADKIAQKLKSKP